MESKVKAKYKEEFNEYHKTLGTLFTEEHATLMQEGERWMKSIAASCMVVATLIAALMFTTAFTLPGGTKNDTGILFLYHMVHLWLLLWRIVCHYSLHPLQY